MAQNKTRETNVNVTDFISSITDSSRREDCSTLCKAISKKTGFKAKMWGSAIIGFGNYHYKYESGREGDAPLVGIASRSTAIVLYLSGYFADREKLLAQLGKHKTGKGCIYIQKLDDIDIDILLKMVENSSRFYADKYKAV